MPPACFAGYRRIDSLLSTLTRYGRKQGNGGTRTLRNQIPSYDLSRPGNWTALFSWVASFEAPSFPEPAGAMPAPHLASTACFVTARAYPPEQHATQIRRSQNQQWRPKHKATLRFRNHGGIRGIQPISQGARRSFK